MTTEARSAEERSIEIRERPNSIEVHRNARGEWSTSVKCYFGHTQEDAEAAKEWLDELNLRLLISYPTVQDVQTEVLAQRLEASLTLVRERDGSS